MWSIREKIITSRSLFDESQFAQWRWTVRHTLFWIGYVDDRQVVVFGMGTTAQTIKISEFAFGLTTTSQRSTQSTDLKVAVKPRIIVLLPSLPYLNQFLLLIFTHLILVWSLPTGHTHIIMILYSFLVPFALFSTALAVELTFELPDNAKQCFHEDIRQGVDSTVEFQVLYY